MAKPRKLPTPTSATAVVVGAGASASLSPATCSNEPYRRGSRPNPQIQSAGNSPRSNEKGFVELFSPPSPLEGQDLQYVPKNSEKKLRQSLSSLMKEFGAEAFFREAAGMAASHGVPVTSILQSDADLVGPAISTSEQDGVASNDAPPKTKARKAPVVLPELPKGLSWPSKRYEKHEGIVDFIRTSGWENLIAAGYGELRFLRKLDPKAAKAIAAYEAPRKEPHVRRSLPKELRFLRERDVTDKKIESKGATALRTDSHLTAALAARVARGSKVPQF